MLSDLICSRLVTWIIAFFFIFLASSVQVQADVFVKPVHLECVDESSNFHWSYHAPPHTVPALKTDPKVKRGFLELFRRSFNKGHIHSTPQDPLTMESMCRNNSISSRETLEINDLLGEKDTLSSFSNRNLQAVDKLKMIFMRETTLEGLLLQAREQLYRHEFNQKVWYYSLISVFLSRPDFNGTHLPWPVDATPDLYLPHSILKQVREEGSGSSSSSRPPRKLSVKICTTSSNIFYTEVKYDDLDLTPPTSISIPTTATHDVPATAVSAVGQPEIHRPKRGFQNQKADHGGNLRQIRNNPCSSQDKDDDDDDFQVKPISHHDAISFVDDDKPHHHQRQSESNYIYYPLYEVEVKNEWRNNRDHRHIPSNNDKNNEGYLNPPPPPSEYRTLPIFNDEHRTFRNRRSPQTKIPTKIEGQVFPSPDKAEKEDKPHNNKCIPYNGTRGATGVENLLWYFREDVMLNQHHFYWHQLHPKLGASLQRDDRRGELFFFAHHSILSRYNAERLSNGLPLETPLEFHENADIGPGYDSGLRDSATGRFWTYRSAHSPLKDVIQKHDKNFGFDLKINQVANSLTTLIQHVKEGYLLVNRLDQAQQGSSFPLNIKNMEGVSHLGNTVEDVPRLSTNMGLYRSLHSLGHLAISSATDPDDRCRLLKGVMSDVAVALRDPAFYKMHGLVDTLYNGHKRTLPPYHIHGGEWPLQWNGVRLQSVEVISGNSGINGKVNHVKTFWKVKRFPLEEGIDGSIHEGDDVKVDVCHQHLAHEPFMFKLVVDVDSCAKSASGKGTVRLFMAPRRDLDGRRFGMEETRQLMFQLDAFPVELRRGRNTITRNAQDSSAIQPWSRSLTEMLRDPDNNAAGAGQAEYCGCGWPQHLYIPKGSHQGMEFDLFGMVTNFDEDQVLDSIESLVHPEACNSPYLYCGRPNRKYPDARPMGYPFDRVAFPVYDYKEIIKPGGLGFVEMVRVLRGVEDLEEYVFHVGNSQSSVMLIQHVDKIMPN